MSVGPIFMWGKVFKNGPSKICGRQPSKNVKGYGLLKQIFLRLTCTNFTWSIFEYFLPYKCVTHRQQTKRLISFRNVAFV